MALPQPVVGFRPVGTDCANVSKINTDTSYKPLAIVRVESSFHRLW